METEDSSWKDWLPFGVVLAGAIAIIYCANEGLARRLFLWVERNPGADKIGHFVISATVAFTLNLALRGRRVPLVPILVGTLLMFFVATVEEVSQLWLTRRTFDLRDLLANYAGIACADWLARRWLR